MSARKAIARANLLLFLVLLTACATTSLPIARNDVWGCENGLVARTACSSYHAAVANIFVSLARGDVAAAMYYLLGFLVRGGTVKQVSDNGVHIAVKFGGRVFDAYTGPGGMAEKEYLENLQTFRGQNIATKEYPSFPSLFQGLE